MATWQYKHATASKVNGGVPQASQFQLVEAIEDFVNTLGPKPDGIQCILSEGPTSRDFHCWVRMDNGPNRYDLTHVIWNSNDPNATVDAVTELLEHDIVLVGFDGGTMQSIHYFRRIN